LLLVTLVVGDAEVADVETGCAAGRR
jgi:hypothetical protein